MLFGLLGHLEQAQLVLRRASQEAVAIPVSHPGNIVAQTNDLEEVEQHVLVTLIPVLHVAVCLIDQR